MCTVRPTWYLIWSPVNRVIAHTLGRISDPFFPKYGGEHTTKMVALEIFRREGWVDASLGVFSTPSLLSGKKTVLEIVIVTVRGVYVILSAVWCAIDITRKLVAIVYAIAAALCCC